MITEIENAALWRRGPVPADFLERPGRFEVTEMRGLMGWFAVTGPFARLEKIGLCPERCVLWPGHDGGEARALQHAYWLNVWAGIVPTTPINTAEDKPAINPEGRRRLELLRANRQHFPGPSGASTPQELFDWEMQETRRIRRKWQRKSIFERLGRPWRLREEVLRLRVELKERAKEKIEAITAIDALRAELEAVKLERDELLGQNEQAAVKREIDGFQKQLRAHFAPEKLPVASPLLELPALFNQDLPELLKLKLVNLRERLNGYRALLGIKP